MDVAIVTAYDRYGQLLGRADVNICDYKAWGSKWKDCLGRVECHCKDCGQRVYTHFPTADIDPYYAASPTAPHYKGCKYYSQGLIEKAAYLDLVGADIKLTDLLHMMRAGTLAGNGEKKPTAAKEDFADPDEAAKAVETPDKCVVVTKKSASTLVEVLAICKSDESSTYAGHPKKEILVDRSTIHYHREHWGADGQIKLVICGRTTAPKVVEQRMETDGIKQMCLVFEAKYPLNDGERRIYYVVQFPDAASRDKALKLLWKQADKATDGKEDKYLAFGSWDRYDGRSWFDAYICKLTNLGCYHKLPKKYDYE